MSFVVDPRIVSSGIALGDWPLSRVFLNNNACYPWLILVPRCVNIHEIHQLPRASQHQLMDEISALSTVVQSYFKPDTLNVGALGNIVSQLHVHVIARFTQDALWPQGVWQEVSQKIPYEKDALEQLRFDLSALIFT